MIQQVNPQTLGERLRLYRLRKNMTRKELAEIAEVTVSTICNYENDVTAPNIRRLTAIARALDVTVSMLMRGCEPEKEFEPLVTGENLPC